MEINFEVSMNDIGNIVKKPSLRQEAILIVKEFVKSGKPVCEIKYSGSIGSANTCLLYARKKVGVDVKVMRRGTRIFLVKTDGEACAELHRQQH